MRPCRSSILNVDVDRCVFQQQAFDSCCRFLSLMYVWWCWYLFPFKCVLCLLCPVDCAVVVVKNAHCVIWCIVNLVSQARPPRNTNSAEREQNSKKHHNSITHARINALRIFIQLQQRAVAGYEARGSSVLIKASWSLDLAGKINLKSSGRSKKNLLKPSTNWAWARYRKIRTRPHRTMMVWLCTTWSCKHRTIDRINQWAEVRHCVERFEILRFEICWSQESSRSI